MTRKLAIGLMFLSLAGCGKDYAPVKSTPSPLDVPDAALVAPCDTTNGDPATNVALALELARTRRQRDDCSSQVDGLGKWRQDAIQRHKEFTGK